MKLNCPICGENNDCAMERAEKEQVCWCMSISIPQSLLAQVPESMIGVSCICRACALRVREDDQAPPSPKSAGG